jgi:WXG100 family type VII secretion target
MADVAIHYQTMAQIANTFDAEARRVQEVVNAVESHLSTLKNGGWIADAATRYYNEMDNEISPSLERLQSALVAAGDVSPTIIQIMTQAEKEAAAQLRGEAVAIDHSSVSCGPSATMIDSSSGRCKRDDDNSDVADKFCRRKTAITIWLIWKLSRVL